MDVIIFLGPPGSGKGTQARLLSRSLKIPLMGMGDLLRNEINRQTVHGQKIQKAVDSGEIPDWSLVSEIFEENLKLVQAQKLIFDGIPRNNIQIPEVMHILNRRNAVVQKAIFLNVPEHILAQRIQQRCQCAQCGTACSIAEGETVVCKVCQSMNFVRRNDDQQEAMNRRFSVYQESIGDLVSFFKNMNILSELDGTQPIPMVHQQIMSALNYSVLPDHSISGDRSEILIS